MKWFSTWLQARLNASVERADHPLSNTKATKAPGAVRSERASTVNSDKPLQILVHNAVGGKVVEVQVRQPDHWNVTVADEPRIALYIVPDDMDLGQELGKIITTEFLKNG